MRKRRKTVLTLLLAALLVFALVKFISPDFWRQAVAAVGIAEFTRESLPRYLRQRLSVPQNPVDRREKLLEELSTTIGGIESELEAAALGTGGEAVGGKTGEVGGMTGPGRISSRGSDNNRGSSPQSNLSGAAPGGPGLGAGGSAPVDLHERIERAQDLLVKTEAAIEELKGANRDQGFLAKAAERALDKILPATQGAGTGGTIVCETR